MRLLQAAFAFSLSFMILWIKQNFPTLSTGTKSSLNFLKSVKQRPNRSNVVFAFFFTSADCFPLVALIMLLSRVIQYPVVSLASLCIIFLLFALSLGSAWCYPSSLVLYQWDTLEDSYLANCKCWLIPSVLFILHALSAVKGSVPVHDLILKELVAQCMKKFPVF